MVRAKRQRTDFDIRVKNLQLREDIFPPRQEGPVAGQRYSVKDFELTLAGCKEYLAWHYQLNSLSWLKRSHRDGLPQGGEHPLRRWLALGLRLAEHNGRAQEGHNQSTSWTHHAGAYLPKRSLSLRRYAGIAQLWDISVLSGCRVPRHWRVENVAKRRDKHMQPSPPRLVQRSEFATLQQTRIFCKKHNSGSPTKQRFTTHLLGTGADIWTIRLLLGHRSLQTTMICTHLLEATRLVTSPLDYLRT